MTCARDPLSVQRYKPVLIVLHGEHSTSGRIGRLLRELGAPLDIRRPRFGDPLPRHLGDHSGAVFFGGPMSANDEEDWLKREIDWLAAPLKENKPFLGICLGAQLLARQLGQKVDAHPEGKVEVGYYPIHPTEHGHCLCDSPFPTRVYQWHREGFDCPKGAVLLAEGEDFQAQAIKVGDKAFGLQFHPDVTYEMICRWTITSLDRIDHPGVQSRQRHIDGWFQHDRSIARWTVEFLKRWLGAPEFDGRIAPAE
ncbi:GMP synthase (glutamine-hydrolysing) [Rhodoblastus acidophilus]|uniref:GMP synthase (Glutamine-hydrolysing) n=1 Tax=Rhodoblastus acidophilus TaxID=1074 RepID=A0A212RLC7_RHOAC|nr:glutamine amidotransferase [Rhodoblastus acidophilus]PPQ39057.1 glutamine amidotransferase [Rhodoblastus acidophilus]RAI24232.1 glutamine amidotransferase [Rhodoblastus acidophilus]SNB73123.1 GMP synthase (glutamine-hydrolysing) [Rhodoblastus acidophilus]